MLDYFKNISSDEDSEDSYITYTFYAFFTILTFLIFYFLFIYGTNNNNIQNSDIITYILTSVFIITVIYYLIFHQNIYNKMVYNYYAIQYQLIDVYNTDMNYYNILFNLIFIFISSIITIIIYWDNVYKNSLKISNCKSILKIIEDNSVIRMPYIYSIIIVNINKIDSKLDNYILKIKYDFKSKLTTFYYGKDNGIDNNIFNSIIEKNNMIQKKINELETKIIDLEKKINDENDKDNIYGLRYQLKKMKNSDVYETYLLTKDKYGDDLSKFYYFDLNTMKPVYIDGVNVKALNNINEYKYFCVDETGNLVKTHTANLLVDFTKIYSYNINHSTSLIYNILFANKNKDKISL